MLRSADVAQGALLSPFQVGLGAFCHYDREDSEERRSEENLNAATQPTKFSNSASRSLGMASSACRGVLRNSGVACAPWVPSFLAATYFQPCERHRHHKKNECTFFCITCGLKPHSICQHCMGAHAGHQVIQVRRYVYCDVVRACDINPFVDASGVQNYIINSAKVMFLNHRPHSKIGRANGVDICRTCHRHLREGFSYCSLACKVEALTKGETLPVPTGPNGISRLDAAAEAATGPVVTATTTAAPGAVPFTSSSPRSLQSDRERPSLGGNPATGHLSSQPRSLFGSLPPRASAVAAGGSFRAATASAFAPLSSSDVVAADASCAALSSDPESSELGEDTFVLGREVRGGSSGAGKSPLDKRRDAIAAAMVAAVARRRLAAGVGRGGGGGEGEADRGWSSNGSASSKDEDDCCYEYNFENPPKRRRTSHITRRPSSSNGFFAPPAPSAPPQLARGCFAATDSDGGATTDMEAAAAAATAAATLLMPFRTTSSGLIPAAPAPPSPPSGGFTTSSFFGSLDSSVPTCVSVSADLARAASAPVAMSSRRKQHAPQRAPSY